MALSKICLECLGGKKQDEAIEWLELAASFGHPLAKALLYRVSKALGCYDQRKDKILSYLLESAENGIRTAVDDIMVIDMEKGKVILQTLKQKRQDQCEPHNFLFNDCFPI